MTEKAKYIKEMREYWQATRGAGIPGTRASEPANLEQIIGDYYDKYVRSKDGNQEGN